MLCICDCWTGWTVYPILFYINLILSSTFISLIYYTLLYLVLMVYLVLILQYILYAAVLFCIVFFLVLYYYKMTISISCKRSTENKWMNEWTFFSTTINILNLILLCCIACTWGTSWLALLYDSRIILLKNGLSSWGP
jgi:hypothetical protein